MISVHQNSKNLFGNLSSSTLFTRRHPTCRILLVAAVWTERSTCRLYPKSSTCIGDM